ncbi:TPA: replicative DNA helicase [Mannheimia haemolytica]|uniref:Replicative DNA helicase n=4 Tax=Pasteurellaceae TaxID=712 RepID=A0A9Q6Z1X8_HISSO|nr:MULTISPECIES: replicative DNA helicase [Pasteurellaceae]AWW59088.1 replicative DNA helicase [Pasteurellaceae bacterium 12591]AWW71724.1 replicative DNA helicase [Pasteurellaceae bacterium 12565]ACA31531.1 replicative DNA helicase [Histophilus somni 2336]AGK02768.1 replicative DNA helicase DnaB [Mannheimia haemolytica M42548]AHG73080.1 Replicative DNA helicase [Mannheimia sp. USDA-ARS-USMARC-1261]
MSSLNKSLVQPHSIEAEFSVIGGLLLDNELFDEVSSKINEGDFYNFTHRLLFKHISELIEAGKPADILTLDQYLTQKKVIEDLGGFAYLAEIVKNTPSTANIHAYTDIVLLYSKQRQLLKLGQFIVDQTQSAKTPDKFEAVVDDIEKKITEFSLSDNTKSAADLSDIFANMLSRMELSAKNGDPVTGTPTGIQGIDEATTGGQPGDLIVIGARPSMGKTAFSQTIAYHTLKKFESAPVFYHSMEMPADQILQRFLAMRARVGLQNIRQADSLDDEEWSKLTSAMGYILEHWKNRLVIDDEGSLTPQKLRTKVRQNARKYGKPAAIFIDYIQLMQTSQRYENRNLEIANISRSLKLLAKEMDCPVYALSQLNRSVEQRANKRPINSDLRESGSLEQDADVILFIYRDEVYDADSPFKGTAEIIIGKQRNGPLTSVMTNFRSEFALFENRTNTTH